MCGRYILTVKRKQIAAHFAAQDSTPDDATPSIVAPSQVAPVITAEHKLEAMRWGLRPTWEPESGRSVLLINARAETLAQKPTFHQLLAQQRCFIPANGFFEWEKLPGGRKRPVCYRLRQHGLFAFAGLWDQQRDDAGNVVHAFTIITTAANEAVRVIHDRMPVILTPETEAAWLKPAQTIEDLLALLCPYSAQPLVVEDGAPLLATPASSQKVQPLLPF
ncbi:MAG: SOS response-associated peptidase [Verrucomicrobia bacterium]|nr:MAG: SOS response-associated peptidase [Verrucomicrobiota bacterium]